MPFIKFAHNICKIIKADNITAYINNNLTWLDENNDAYNNSEPISVWPYAIYYPYYEQYTTMVEDAVFQIGVCLIPVFVFTFFLLGFDFISGLIVLLTVTMIVRVPKLKS